MVGSQELPVINITPGKYSTYYYLRYTLSNTNEVRISQPFSEGGQFELRIRKDAFPVAAPKCKGDIILRMPGTAPTVPDAAHYIDEKRTLYERIRHLPEAGLEVVLELNPYLQVVTTSPLQLELTQCNVFFRQSQGRYIPGMD